jgi:glycosyltransferase involved in cell wall biosynthesis
MHFCFINMPIEYYSPMSGGAISTIIAETARELLAQGRQVTVLSRVDGVAIHPHGKVVPLASCAVDDLNLFQRRLSGLRSRINEWDWPNFDYYRAAVTRALKRLSSTPDALVLFNDLVSPIFLRKLFPNAHIFVWLQNEQHTRQRDLAASSAATSGWLTCSHSIREWTLAKYSFDPARVSVVPSGVNLDQFFPRDGYDEPSEEVRVLFVGRIDRNKGPDLAVDAVAALREQGLPVTITVAGGKWFYGNGDEALDPYLLSLREKMQRAQATELGHVPRDRIAEVFRQHDIVCVLSRSKEPFGLVVLEAMASGCAVIASDRGGLPEACGGAAKLVDPDNLPSVTEALRSLVTDPQALVAAKHRARHRAAKATWRHTVQHFEAALGEGHAADHSSKAA